MLLPFYNLHTMPYNNLNYLEPYHKSQTSTSRFRKVIGLLIPSDNLLFD